MKPFSPSETRVLLVIMMDKVGSVVSKRGRATLNETRLSVGDNDRLRRPVGVACVDITKDLLPVLIPFHTTLRPPERHQRSSLVFPFKSVILRR